MRLIILALTLLAGPALAEPTCSIKPSAPVIAPGESVNWSVAYDGFSREPNGYRWAFTGGTKVSSGAASVTVAYPTAGEHTAALRLLATPEIALCSTTVVVQEGGEQPPVEEPPPVEPPPVVTPPVDVAVTIRCGEGVACTCTTD